MLVDELFVDELTSKQGVRKKGFRELEPLEPCIVENTRFCSRVPICLISRGVYLCSRYVSKNLTYFNITTNV